MGKRLIVGLLACAGGVNLALAANPPVAPDSAPAAPAPRPAAVAQTSKVADVSMQERHFLSEGYKPEMINGEKIFCRRETVLGSRLTAYKICGTIVSLTAAEAATRKDVEQAQRQQMNAVIPVPPEYK